MNRRKHFFFLMMSLLLMGCQNEAVKDVDHQPLIPRPVTYETKQLGFQLKSNASIIVSQEDKGMRTIGKYLAEVLRPSTGFDLEVKDFEGRTTDGNIYLLLSSEPVHPSKESYQIDVTEENIIIKGHDPEGIFRGVQSLRQLFPYQIELNEKQDMDFLVQVCHIVDYPRFTYRSAMLDVSRHFFSVEDVKKYIDVLSYYKVNKFHMHLTDDQGWRIEIKAYPELAKKGGSLEVGGGKGGYYTQEEFKDIVKYAADRYITIIPEIDMPGHTNAALASVPELNCDGKSPKLYTGTDVGFSTLCTSKEFTYDWVDAVVRELSEISPGRYIHIGGDESFATKKKDYINFVTRVQSIVNKHGKEMIGWEEIIQADLNTSSVSQFWRNDSLAKVAADKDIPVIYSNARRCYLDMKYDTTTHLGLHWAGYIDVRKAYDWDITTLSPGIPLTSVLGVEAPLWTETVTNIKELEYMAFPRMIGYAELSWTPLELRKWEEYKFRLAKHKNRLEAMGVNFFHSTEIPWE